MTTSKLSRDVMMELMAYADGELDEVEAARVERLISKDSDAQRVVESMGVLGRVVTGLHDASYGGATDGLADAIMAKVAQEGAPRSPSIRPPRVVDLRDAREKRVKVGAAIVAVIALAAGIVLTTRKANETPMRQAKVGAGASPATGALGTAPPPPQAVAAAGVDLEQVDSENDVAVFYLPSSVGANASSVVVWIDDKGAAP